MVCLGRWFGRCGCVWRTKCGVFFLPSTEFFWEQGTQVSSQKGGRRLCCRTAAHDPSAVSASLLLRPLWFVPAVAAAAMEQQRGKGGAAGTGDVDHAVAEVLLSPALTSHPFDAFRVPAVPCYRHACCLPLRLLCFPAPLAVLTVYRKVFLIVMLWLLLLLPVTLSSVAREEEVLWKKKRKKL